MYDTESVDSDSDEEFAYPKNVQHTYCLKIIMRLECFSKISPSGKFGVVERLEKTRKYSIIIMLQVQANVRQFYRNRNKNDYAILERANEHVHNEKKNKITPDLRKKIEYIESGKKQRGTHKFRTDANFPEKPSKNQVDNDAHISHIILFYSHIFFIHSVFIACQIGTQRKKVLCIFLKNIKRDKLEADWIEFECERL